jgi:phage terminase large subunit
MEFETPELQEFLLGADWGYANDPTTLVRMFIREQTLYIDYEAYQIGIEIDDIPMFFGIVPQSRNFTIRADSSRPDTISYVSNHGYPKLEAAEKGKNSIIEGIQFIRSFEKVIIHPRCKHTIDEFKNYRFKTNKVTNEIINVPEDKWNHSIDAIRYALEPYMKDKQSEVKVADWDFIQRR